MLIKCLTIFLMGAVAYAAPMQKLVIAGPMASVSHPVFHMIKTNALQDAAKEVEFKLWKSPDELRALAINQQAHILALPTNVAATLYNKGVELELIHVPVWGILSVVSRDQNIKTLADLKGQTVVVPFRSDMPDIVFQILLKANGIDPQKDLSITYAATPIDAIQAIVFRRADNALLAEPSTSLIMRKSGSFPLKLVAPSLYRSVDIQKSWGATFEREPSFPMAGFAALKGVPDKVIARFIEEFKKSQRWYLENPQAAGELVGSQLDFLTAESVSDSIHHIQFRAGDLQDQKSEIQFFYQKLYKHDPKIIGSKLPADAFYRSSPASK